MLNFGDKYNFESLEKLSVLILDKLKESKLSDNFENDRKFRIDILEYAISINIIAVITNNNWILQTCTKTYNTTDYYLKTLDNVDTIDNKKHKRRIKTLAEMLFNLQDIQGIDDLIKKITKDSIEPLFAELEVARLLLCDENKKYRFEFNKPSGIKGKDYDCKIQYNSETICGEIKCKVEETQFSKRTILNSLVAAKHQLPKDTEGMIFLKIPSLWAETEDLDSLKNEAISEFLRNSSRKLTVYPFWDVWRVFNNGDWLNATGIEYYSNFEDELAWMSIDEDTNTNFEWTEIGQLANLCEEKNFVDNVFKK